MELFLIGLTANAMPCIAGNGLPRRFAPRNDVVVGWSLRLSYFTRHCEAASRRRHLVQSAVVVVTGYARYRYIFKFRVIDLLDVGV